ncbi:MAG: flagellar protein [Clostridia bacterium]|nr:flagellar protein [Clostridia bacterium]
MVEELRNCKICGRLFRSISDSSVCVPCMEQDEKNYHRIREYLIEHPLSKIFEVSNELSIPVSRIKRYLREGWLEIVEKDNRFLDCEICGTPIHSGKYCEQCAEKARHEYKSSYSGGYGTKTAQKLNFHSRPEKAVKKVASR